MITLDALRRLAADFPGLEESTSYGTPAFKVAKQLVLRLHDREDAIVLLLDTMARRDALLEDDPLSYFITDHYRDHAIVLVRPTVPETAFRDLLEIAWRRVARRRDLDAFEG